MKIRLIIEGEGSEECEAMSNFLDGREVPVQGIFRGFQHEHKIDFSDRHLDTISGEFTTSLNTGIVFDGLMFNVK